MIVNTGVVCESVMSRIIELLQQHTTAPAVLFEIPLGLG